MPFMSISLHFNFGKPWAIGAGKIKCHQLGVNPIERLDGDVFLRYDGIQ